MGCEDHLEGAGKQRLHRFALCSNCKQYPATKRLRQRNGCVSETESQKRREFLRFQREHCNELWQIDFKGDFPLLDGTRCFPLDIIDDCSRYCLGIYPKNNTLGVTQHLIALYALSQYLSKKARSLVFAYFAKLVSAVAVQIAQ